MARPSKFSPERTAAILTALRAGNTRKASAGYGGVDVTTLRDWINQHPDFAADVDKAEADAEVRNVARIQTAIEEHWQAAAWWLERRRHKDWRQRKTIDWKDLPDDRLVALLEESVEDGGEEEGAEDTG